MKKECRIFVDECELLSQKLAPSLTRKPPSMSSFAIECRNIVDKSQPSSGCARATR